MPLTHPVCGMYSSSSCTVKRLAKYSKKQNWCAMTGRMLFRRYVCKALQTTPLTLRSFSRTSLQLLGGLPPLPPPSTSGSVLHLSIHEPILLFTCPYHHLSRLSRIKSSMLLKPKRLLSSEEGTLSLNETPQIHLSWLCQLSQADCILLFHRPGLASMEDDSPDTRSKQASSLAQ